MFWKSKVKRAATSVLGATGAWRLLPPGYRAEATILTFHRIQRDGLEALDPTFYVTPSYLDGIVRFALDNGYEVASLDTLHNCIAENRFERPLVVLTFDDGYRDNATLAAPVLARHGVPWALYLTSGFPDRTGNYWWRALERAIIEQDSIEIELPGLQQRFATASLAQKRTTYTTICAKAYLHGPALSAQLARRYGAAGAELLDADALTWREVAALASDRNVTIGAHTMSHAALATLPAAEAWQEIYGARQRIMAMTGIDVRHFAPPHGSCDTVGPVHRKMARDAGYLTMTTTQRKSLFLPAPADAFMLPRITVDGGNRQSLPAIACHLSGLTSMMTLPTRDASIPGSRLRHPAADPVAGVSTRR